MKKARASNMTEARKEIRRLWGDLEVVEAQKDLRVFIRPSDIRSAKAKDPERCVFAKACRRQFSATKVLFLKSVAYVDLPDEHGVRRVERFQMSRQMRDLVESFDRGQPIRDVAGFELRKPRPSYTLKAKAASNLLQRHSRSKKAKQKPAGTQGKGAYSRAALPVDLSVRNGMGRVHFKCDKA